MKDLLQLFMYAIITFAAIYLLIAMSNMESIPSTVVVLTAMFLVIVLPVALAVRLGKKERERMQKDNNE